MGAWVLFSTSLHPVLHRLRPGLHRLRVEAILRDVYLAVHAYRTRLRLLCGVFALTVVVQAARVLAIWCAGKAVGVDLSPRPYYVMGPLLFLVMLVPFTINGLAVQGIVLRELPRDARASRPTVPSRPASSSSSSRSRSPCREP